VQAELEQVQVQAQVQAQAQAEFPAQLHDQTILDARLLRETYVVDPKTAWCHAAPLLAQAA
jgi:hypothetical protein